MAITSYVGTHLTQAFKRVYSQKAIMDLSAADRVLWGLIPKSSDFGGQSYDFYVDHAKPAGGRSRSFGDAQDNTSASIGQKFQVTRVPDYGLIHIDRESMEASEKDVGAFFKMKSHEQKLMLDALSDNIWEGLYGSATSSKGVVGTYAGGTPSITLATTYDAMKFEVGQVISVWNDADLTSSGERGQFTVSAIDRVDGIITMSAAVSGTAAGDLLYVEGDFLGSDNSSLGISGLESWIPYSRTSIPTLFGVTRTTDETRLAGLYRDNSGDLIVEGLIKALHLARLHRARGIKTCMMNPIQYGQLCIELEGKTEYCKDTAKGEDGKQLAHISYEGIYVATPYGRVKVYADEMCPTNRAYLLNMDTLEFKSLKGAPRMFITHDRDSSDQIEIRNGYNGNMLCRAPGWNMVLNMPSV